MNDRIMRGVVAGVAGGLAALAVSLLLVDGLGIGTLHFYDISGVMIFEHKPHGLAEKLFAEIGHLGLSATLGAVMAVLFQWLQRSYMWFKGLFIGVAVWYAAHATTVLFKVPAVEPSSLASAIANLVASAVYGLVTVWVLKALDPKTEKAGRRQR